MTGAFDPDTERRFWERRASDSLPFVRPVLALLTALYLAFGFVDAWAFPRHALVTLLALRLVVVAVLAAGCALVWIPSLVPFFIRRSQVVLVTMAIAPSAGILAMGTAMAGQVEGDTAAIGTLGMLTTVSFVYVCARVRFLYATAVAVVATGLGVGWATVDSSVDPLLMRAIAAYAVALNLGGASVSYALEVAARHEFLRSEEIAAEHARATALLRAVLPDSVARRLTSTDASSREKVAERLDGVTVVRVDVIGFTPLASALDPVALGRVIDRLFAALDDLAGEHGVEKIKTLGDGWLGAAGVTASHPATATAAVQFARGVAPVVERVGREAGVPLQVRVGVGTGSVVAGVIGRTRFAFDLWGPAVDAATAMEASGRPDAVHVDAETAKALQKVRWEPDRSSAWV